MEGRNLEIRDAVRVLKEKGCHEVVLRLDPPVRAMKIPQNAQRRMGIKSWGLVDFLRLQKVQIIKE